jgi:L-rhamnose mutarotase
MKNWMYTCSLRDNPDVIQQYDEAHASIWPEVAYSLHSVGMNDIRIWRLGTRLVMLMTTKDNFDPVQATALHRKNHPRCAEWENLMNSLQCAPAEAESNADGTWTEMQLVFNLSQHLP